MTADVQSGSVRCDSRYADVQSGSVRYDSRYADVQSGSVRYDSRCSEPFNANREIYAKYKNIHLLYAIKNVIQASKNVHVSVNRLAAGRGPKSRLAA